MAFECVDSLRSFFGEDPLRVALEIEGETFRQLESRRTLQFHHQGRAYFLKLHSGIAYREVIKNLLQLKQPVLSAANEWHALCRLRALGIAAPEPLAYYDDGGFSPTRHSFIVMGAITDFTDLEAVFRSGRWQVLSLRRRRLLIRTLARAARVLHDAGMAHQDFYACHMLLANAWLDNACDGSMPTVTFIDWHRTLWRSPRSSRYRVKDIGALLYSCIPANLTWQDVWLFWSVYCEGRPAALHDQRLQQRIVRKARKIYQRDFGVPMPDAFLRRFGLSNAR